MDVELMMQALEEREQEFYDGVDAARKIALLSLVEKYYDLRSYKWPDTYQALGWVITELGEVHEILLGRDEGWVRNNSENKPGWDKEKYAEELGDVIFMVIVAGIVEEVDPVDAMLKKMERKICELSDNS